MDDAVRAFLAVAVVTAVAVAGVSALAPPSPSRFPRTVPPASSTFVADSQGGLVLAASINASSVQSGSAVALTVWETNPAVIPVTLQAADSWSALGLALGPCPLVYPFGFKVLKGEYLPSSSAIPGAPGVQLYAGGSYACPAQFNVQSFTFSSDSTRASLGGFCDTANCLTLPMSFTVPISVSFSGASQRGEPLSPGMYTLVVGDEWGAMGILYFAVDPPTSVNPPA